MLDETRIMLNCLKKLDVSVASLFSGCFWVSLHLSTVTGNRGIESQLVQVSVSRPLHNFAINALEKFAISVIKALGGDWC